MGTRVTNFGNIEVTDPVTGEVRVRMGVLGDVPKDIELYNALLGD